MLRNANSEKLRKNKCENCQKLRKLRREMGKFELELTN